MSSIYLGSDHRGFEYKEKAKALAAELGLEVQDQGPSSNASCDYPEFAFRVAEKVAGHPGSLGLLVCGTGVGMSIAANKVAGARAALCCTEDMARLCREHNDANILSLGAAVVDWPKAEAIIRAFVEARMDQADRHEKRRKLVSQKDGSA